MTLFLSRRGALSASMPVHMGDPLIVSVDGPLNENTYSGTMGWSFTLNEPGQATQLRMYAPTDVTREVRLWRNSNQQLLGSVTIKTNPGGWAYATLEDLIPLEAGVQYIVAWVVDGASNYLDSTSLFTFQSGVTVGAPRANTDPMAFPSGFGPLGFIYGVPDVVIK